MSAWSSRSLAPTPLHARTAELCATNRWATVGGFTVPLVYTTEQEEIDAVTSRVGISDLSARQCFRFDGPEAASFLSFALTSDVSSLETGQTLRVAWCDDDGHVRGDGQLVRYGMAHYELSSAVRDFAWFLDGASGFDVRVSNVSGQRAGIGIRGPLAGTLLSAAGFASAAQPASGAAAVPSAPALPAPAWRQTQVALVRDATGEGYELWTLADDGIVVWDRLLRVGGTLGVSPVGAAALEVARLEGGVPLAGVDWQPAQLARGDADIRLPRDIGIHADPQRRFNGSWALARPSAPGTHKLVQLTSAFPVVPGAILVRGSVCGSVTSAAWSEARNKGFAIAWLKVEHSAPGIQVQCAGRHGAVTCQVMRDCFL